MPTVRFRQQHTTAPVRRRVQAPVRQTEALPMIDPPMLPMPPLPTDYTQAIRATQRYSRSYTRLSRSMKNTYGPIPREIPPEYLRRLAPARGASTGPIITSDDEPTTSPAVEAAPPAKPDSSSSKTIVTSVCVILAIIIIGSWAGTQFVSSTLPKPLASQTITRVNQLDPGQYESAAQYSQWADSTCSAAAMTAVINAYGHDYRVADILNVEAAQKQITPELGLLYGVSSVARTVASFGFKAVALDSTSLDSVLTTANSGTPVIIGFMDPVDFPTGHILVVKGGSGDTVDVVDSSKLNLTSMSRARFLHFYDGFAVLVTPINAAPDTSAPVVSATGYSVLGSPSISADTINSVLHYYHSPADGQGQALYDLGVKYHIDPAFPLAFFMNESSFGTQGMATSTLGLGNERCLSDRPCINTQGLPCQSGQSCYAQFYNWSDGFEHWYMLIKNEYVSGHINQVIGRNACPCTSIPQIIPVYAPNSDHNDEAHYIWVVEHAVDTWRSGKVVVA